MTEDSTNIFLNVQYHLKLIHRIKMENVSDKLEGDPENQFGIIIKLVILMHMDIRMQLVIIVQSTGDVDVLADL